MTIRAPGTSAASQPKASSCSAASSTVTVVALLLMLTPAFAAGGIKGAPAAAVVADSYDWTGAFVGAYAGGVRFDGGTSIQGWPNPPQGLLAIGTTVGALAGYDQQVGSNFVIGVQLDGGWVSASTTDELYNNFTVKTTMNWDAHLQGRVGVVVDKALFYLSGGAAVASFTQDLGGSAPDSIVYGSVVGGGIELAITDNVSIRGEYIYSMYPMTSFVHPGGVMNATYSTQEARVGLAYKF